MYYYIFTSIKRQKNRSILVVLVNCVLVILLNLYFGLIDSYQTQLHDLAANTTIKCTVTNPDGTRDVGICISDDVIRGVENSVQVKDLDCSVQLRAGFGEFALEDWEEHLTLSVSAVNKRDSSVLSEELAVQYMEGWDETLFSGNEKVCILNRSDIEKQGYAYGDEVTLTPFYYTYDDINLVINSEKMEPVQMMVVGEIIDTGEFASSMDPDVLLPLQTMRDIFAERRIDFTADAMSFYVRDPLALNDFKSEMKEIGLHEVYKGEGSRSFYKGSALYVQDGIFITMAGRLKTAVRILTTFLVPMAILLFIVGYVVSHLLGSGRVKEFALFRSLGVGQLGTVMLFWSEQILLSFGGNALGCLAALLVGRTGIRETWMTGGAVLVGYMTGTTAALLLLAKKAPLQLLASE